MQIGIHGREIAAHRVELVRVALGALYSRNPAVWVSSKFLPILQSLNLVRENLRVFEQGDDLQSLDVLISLGGDGTLLESVAYVGESEAPVMGVNVGRMGFLATIGGEGMARAIDSLFAKKYTIDSRSMLTIDSETGLFGKTNFALNEFTLIKEETASMIKIDVYVDDQLLNSYWADGMIVATPTGSTGYSLSCGGPLIHPSSETFVITPISPHSLTARPIVVADRACIALQHAVGSHQKARVSLDSRFEVIDKPVRLELKKSRHRARLIQLPEQSYFKTLRQKLSWGLDVRN